MKTRPQDDGRWRWGRRVVALTVLALAGSGLAPVGDPAGEWQRRQQPEFRTEDLDRVVGQGVLLGLFGGFRSLLADFAWVRSYVYWERQDRAGNETFMRLSLLLDPGNIYFWTNAADVIAYDQAHWEIRRRERQGRVRMEQGVKELLFREYAHQGLALLDEAVTRLPESRSQLYVRAGQIAANKLKDAELAASYYRRAAEAENPVWFAGVIYGKVLANRLGRRQEALDWLVRYQEEITKRLPHDPLDIKGAVEEEIDALRREMAEREKTGGLD